MNLYFNLLNDKTKIPNLTNVDIVILSMKLSFCSTTRILVISHLKIIINSNLLDNTTLPS